MANKHRPSLLGGLLWTGLGLLFLLRNFITEIDLWRLASHYWPILLILLGLGKVVDYFLKKDAVSIRIGEIFGVLFLLFAGSSIATISDSHFGRIIRDFPIEINGVSVRPGQWIGNSHTYVQEISHPFDSPAPIRIENSYGMVSIAPSSGREIRIKLKKVIYNNNEMTAKRFADEIRLEAGPEKSNEPEASLKPEAETKSKTAFLIKTNRELLISRGVMFSTDMEILVPKNSQLQVKNAYGEIKVFNINGKLELSTTHRPLEVSSCTGQFILSNRYSESRLTDLTGDLSFEGSGKVYIDKIKGNVNVTDEHSPVEISNVDGKVSAANTDGSIRIEKVTQPVTIEARGTAVFVDNLMNKLKISVSHKNAEISNIDSDVLLDSSYAGLVLRNIKGSVEITSNSDRITADKISGNFKVRGRGSAVHVDEIKGSLDIQTTLKDVTVNDFAGACTVTNEYGHISLSAKTLGKGDISAKNRNGEIDLSLPKDAGFLINATARNGNIESEYAGLEPRSNTEGRSVLKSKVKSSGPAITLETEYSNINIHTRQDESSSQGRTKHFEAEQEEP